MVAIVQNSLDRHLADRRVWPAVDITQSGTRRAELLQDPETLHAATMLRVLLGRIVGRKPSPIGKS